MSSFVGTSYATPRLPEEMLSRWLSTTPTRFRRSGERYWRGAVEHALTLPDTKAAADVPGFPLMDRGEMRDTGHGRLLPYVGSARSVWVAHEDADRSRPFHAD
jgi:hypothetical protein